jgi:hypothetical protein
MKPPGAARSRLFGGARGPLAVYCIVNLLFIVKYGSRIGPVPVLVSCIAFAVFCFVAAAFLQKLPVRFFSRRSACVLMAVVVALSLVAFWGINVHTVRVDRWSVIQSFWDDLFQGKYPYAARSNQGNPPGPFPFYFVIALPFYAIGEIGLMTLASLVFFFLFLNRKTASDRTLFLQTVLLAASPAMIWEIMVRSTIFVNFCLVVFYISWLENRVFPGQRKQVFVPGLVGGLLLSTRALAAVPILCYLSYALVRKKDFVTFVKLGSGVALGFCATFIPLLFWGTDAFMKNNPVMLQAGFVPIGITIGFVLVSCIGGLLCRSFDSCLGFCGIVIFCILAVSMGLAVLDVGWHNALFGSQFDISYFIFTIPFAIASLEDRADQEQFAH